MTRSAERSDVRAPPAEVRTATALLLAALLLRVFYVFHYRIDTDEPQHLHVVWSWVHGLLQYRDVFDNHAPLFHLMLAPLLAMLGERADIVLQMRLAMLPFYALSLGCTYAVAVALFSRRVALWAAVLTALYGGFFLTSLEFRADDLWAALWLLGLALLVHGQVTRRRCLGVGVLFGATLGVSVKTVLLLVSVTIAAFVTPALVHERGNPRTPCHFAPRAIALFAGLMVFPASLIGFFAWQGALRALYYGTIAHNALPGLGLWHSSPSRAILVPVATPLLWVGGRLVGRSAPTAHIGARRVLVFLTAGIFLVLLLGVWPLVTREDFLPVDPLVVLLATGFGLALPSTLRTVARRLPRFVRRGMALPIAVATIEVVMLVQSAPPWQDGTRDQTNLVATVLRLTRPGDYVMDVKGETVFRQRPFYYALEHITKTRLQRGLIADDIADRLIATRTAVVTPDQSSFPPTGRTFMNDNYLTVGSLRVLGRFLTPQAGWRPPTDDSARTEPAHMPFAVAVPANYAIVTDAGQADGLLDGTPYGGPRFLASGVHEFISYNEPTGLALVWAPALERGFSPFTVGGGR
jgi:hypothetical protein